MMYLDNNIFIGQSMQIHLAICTRNDDIGNNSRKNTINEIEFKVSDSN
jgi:hypothetical protein